ncbi:hypothetical protein ACFL6D_02485 [Spirochaetota bacterium]
MKKQIGTYIIISILISSISFAEEPPVKADMMALMPIKGMDRGDERHLFILLTQLVLRYGYMGVVESDTVQKALKEKELDIMGMVKGGDSAELGDLMNSLNTTYALVIDLESNANTLTIIDNSGKQKGKDIIIPRYIARKKDPLAIFKKVRGRFKKWLKMYGEMRTYVCHVEGEEVFVKYGAKYGMRRWLKFCIKPEGSITKDYIKKSYKKSKMRVKRVNPDVSMLKDYKGVKPKPGTVLVHKKRLCD